MYHQETSFPNGNSVKCGMFNQLPRSPQGVFKGSPEGPQGFWNGILLAFASKVWFQSPLREPFWPLKGEKNILLAKNELFGAPRTL